MPIHCPDFEILLDYASGNLPVAPSVTIAVHSSMCFECNNILKSIDTAGAVLIDDLPIVELDTNSLDNVLSRLDNDPFSHSDENIVSNIKFQVPIPKVLKPYIPNDLNWIKLSSGVKILELLSSDGFKLNIYKILPGYTIPKHTHTGNEFTLVFDGGFTDGNKHFGPGDFSLLDHNSDHSPKADLGKDCYCIVAMNSKIKFTGTFSKFLNFLN